MMPPQTPADRRVFNGIFWVLRSGAPMARPCLCVGSHIRPAQTCLYVASNAGGRADDLGATIPDRPLPRLEAD